MRAELRGAEIGLHIAWELGLRKVILELDSSSALAAILGSQPEDTRHGHIIQHIRNLRNRQWQVKLHHSYRETNQVADLLAHLGHRQSLGTHIVCDLPSNVLAALRSDCIGVVFPRSIIINS
ncbi:Putative ribonuclease H protein At1g65750 [Linum perenne]